MAKNINEFMEDLKKRFGDRQVQLMSYGLVALVALLVLLLAHRPLALSLQNSERQWRALDERLRVQRGAIEALKKADLAEQLMKYAELSLAIDDITEFGRTLGLKFVSITPKEVKYIKEGNFNALPITFKIEGTYMGLGELLVYLETFPRTVVGIEDLTVHPKGVADILDVDLLMNLYMEAENGQE